MKMCTWCRSDALKKGSFPSGQMPSPPPTAPCSLRRPEYDPVELELEP